MLPTNGGSRRVAIVQRAIRSYREGFYDELRAELAQDGIDLLLFHSTPAPDRDVRTDALEVPWATHLQRRVLSVGHQELVWQPLDGRLRTVDLLVVEQATQLLLNYRLLALQSRGGPPVAFWGHGRSFAARPGSPSERLKAWSSAKAHWWFAYTSLSAEVVRDLGFPPERITVVNNSIDTTTLKRDLASVDHRRLGQLRERLGLGEGPVGLFLGTLREDKRLDVLIEAGRRIRQVHPDFVLLIVGSGPLELELCDLAEHESWLHFLGVRRGSERAELLALADVLLVPGAIGLVVLDAIVAGTPLITSRESAHGPEIAYLRDGENGLMVRDGTDPPHYADAVSGLLGDRVRLQGLVEQCQAERDRFTLEDMVSRFADGIRGALEAARR